CGRAASFACGTKRETGEGTEKGEGRREDERSEAFPSPRSRGGQGEGCVRKPSEPRLQLLRDTGYDVRKKERPSSDRYGWRERRKCRSNFRPPAAPSPRTRGEGKDDSRLPVT